MCDQKNIHIYIAGFYTYILGLAYLRTMHVNVFILGIFVKFPSLTKHSNNPKPNPDLVGSKRFRDVEEARAACQSRGEIPDVF